MVMLLHMSLEMRSISKFFLATLTMSLLGCAVFEEKAGPKPVGLPQEKIFYGQFEDVWRATQLALQEPTSYPLRINNMDTGIFETEMIKGSQVWRPPGAAEVNGGGYAYRIIVRVIKGNTNGKQAYKVTVQKEMQIQRDFFSEPEKIPSDGLEEKVILYRVDREMQIDRAIRRLNQKLNKNS